MAGATSAALLHACDQSSENKQSREGELSSKLSSESKMSLSLGAIIWVGLVPLYIAQQKGFYEEAGLNLSLQIFPSNGEYLSAFLANQIDGIASVCSEVAVLKS